MTTMKRIRESIKQSSYGGFAFDGYAHPEMHDEDLDVLLAQIKTILDERDLTEGEIINILTQNAELEPGKPIKFRLTCHLVGLAKAIIAARDRKRGGE